MAKANGPSGGGSMPIQQHQQEEEEARFISSLLTESEQNRADPNHPAAAAEKGGQQGNNSSGKEAELADIARALNKIKAQNTVTHALLGAVIVLTAVWQVNEVSFLLWLQRKLSNPFKSLGDLVRASLVKFKHRKPPVIGSSPLPPVGVPDVTRADLPTLVISGDHHRSDVRW